MRDAHYPHHSVDSGIVGGKRDDEEGWMREREYG